MGIPRDPSTLQGQTINSDGAALVQAITEPELAHASADGDAYAYASVTQSLGTNETGLFVKNTDTKPLHLEAAWLSVDADSVITIHYPTTEVTSPDGVNAGEVNLNTGEPSDGDRAVSKTDETTNALGDVIWAGEIMAASNPFKVDLSGASRLIKNRSVAIDSTAAVTAFNFIIHAHFEE